MVLIYVAMFMTAILTFWLTQVLDYNSTIDRNVTNQFSKQIMLEHERSVESFQDPFLGINTGGIDDYIGDFVGETFTQDTLLAPPAGESLLSKCYNPKGKVVDCYDDIDLGLTGIYNKNYDTSIYEFRTNIVAEVDSATIQAVSYVDIDQAKLGQGRITQRDLYRGFIGDLGYNLSMGLIKKDDKQGDDYLFNTGVSEATQVRVSQKAILADECFDIYGECFVMVSELADIVSVASGKSVEVFVNANKPDTIGEEEGVLFAGPSSREISLFVGDEGVADTDGAKVRLYVSFAAYSDGGNEVPNYEDPSSSESKYNGSLLDMEDLVFKDSSGNEIDITNKTSYSENDITLAITPNFNQYGGVYVTVTAVYSDSTVGLPEKTILKNSTTFLVYIAKIQSNRCDGDGDGIILDEDDGWERDSDGYWFIGGSDESNLELATDQLLCISQNQTSSVLSANYRMRTDAEFDISFDVNKTYMDKDGNVNTASLIQRSCSGEPSKEVCYYDNKSSTYEFLHSISKDVINNADWNGDGDGDVFDPVAVTKNYGWIPLGSSGAKFTGIFDGNEKKIINLFIEKERINEPAGLFGVTSGATINNVHLSNAFVSSTNSSSGLLMGQGNGNIEGVDATGVVAIGNRSGGLIGEVDGDTYIEDGTLNVDVISGDGSGGIVGMVIANNDHGFLEVHDIEVHGDIQAEMNSGGLVGTFYVNGVYESPYLDIYTSKFTGNVSASDVLSATFSEEGFCAGGFFGCLADNTEAYATDSYVEGNIYGSGDKVGGFLGGVGVGSLAVFGPTFFTGDVMGQNKVGGIVGEASSQVVVFETDIYGDSYIYGENYVGGVVGNSTGLADFDQIDIGGSLIEGYDYVGGLAGSVSHSNAISRIGIDNITIHALNNVGGLVGSGNENLTISNCYVNAEIAGDNNLGGLVGDTVKSIDNSYSLGSVDGYNNIGGLVGSFVQSLDNSYSNAYVGGRDNVGGLLGYGEDSTKISKSFFTNSVYGEHSVGGLVGYLIGENSSISESFSTSNVSGLHHLGGLVGTNRLADISLSYSIGDVETSDKTLGRATGGIIGWAPVDVVDSVKSDITDVYATGAIKGAIRSAGLIGDLENGFVDSSYSSSVVSGASEVAGLIGSLLGSVNSSYALNDNFTAISGIPKNIYDYCSDSYDSGCNKSSIVSNFDDSTWMCKDELDGTPILKSLPDVTKDASGNLIMNGSLSDMSWDDSVWENLCSSNPKLEWEDDTSTVVSSCTDKACISSVQYYADIEKYEVSSGHSSYELVATHVEWDYNFYSEVPDNYENCVDDDYGSPYLTYCDVYEWVDEEPTVDNTDGYSVEFTDVNTALSQGYVLKSFIDDRTKPNEHPCGGAGQISCALRDCAFEAYWDYLGYSSNMESKCSDGDTYYLMYDKEAYHH